MSPGWDREGSSTGAYFEAVTRNKLPRQFRTNRGDRFFIRHFWDKLREQANRSTGVAALDWKLVALGHNTVRGAAGAAALNAELMYSEGLLD